ncbi:MAG TPA: ATPase, T2SS/T4P/T4SS family [Syntrophorhabdales bacterium]|nr:ATPase, T2SS/T4P/T4SS family [Syntrophorhabdales bacterium]
MPSLVKKRLGEILVDAKKLKEEDLHKALSEQRKYGEKLGNVLIRMGLLSEKEIMETVSKQLGIPIVNLFDANLSEELVRLIPENVAKSHMVIPFERNFSVLRLAMIDPLDINALDEVARFLRMEVSPCIVTRSEMKWALERYYGIKSLVEETLDIIKEREALGEEEEEEEEKPPVEIAEDEPVIKFVNSLLAQALADNASDIHVEPAEDMMRIRMRVDGRLREMQAPQKKMLLPIISRVKIMAGMDIAKTRIPQDGRFDITKEVGVRVSTYPTMWGEKAVLRLLDKTAALYGIDKLGLLVDDEDRLKRVLTRAYGFVLSTGPTGSGKTTTLYAILNHIHSVEKNIITIEDPVEYTIDYVAQAQVNVKAGLTFESGLRSMLRQDPDIIMVGEIRDKETATIAIHAALTGHIVLSTFHTNDAPGALTRLVEMGIEPFLVASSVSCVMGQRLLRKICEDCKEAYMPPPAVLESIDVHESVPLYRGRGCPVCRNSGFKGRTGVFEVLVMEDEVRELVVDKVSTEVIKKKAMEMGMREMREDAIKKALLGVTTLEEALNTTQLD